MTWEWWLHWLALPWERWQLRQHREQNRELAERVVKRTVEMVKIRDIQLDAYISGSEGCGLPGIEFCWASARDDHSYFPTHKEGIPL